MPDLEAPPRDDVSGNPEASLPPNNGGMSGCALAAIGCAVFSLVLICIGLAGVYWLTQNARGIAANMVTPAIQEVVSQMEIPVNQKKQISARIEQLGEDFKNQKIGVDDLSSVLAGLAESPLARAAAAIWFTDDYIAKSGLTADEKSEAKVTSKRFATALLDKSVSDKDANEVFDLVCEEAANGQTVFKPTLTDPELRELVGKMKKAADNADVPSNVPEINFASEFDAVVRKSLATDPKAKSAASTSPDSEMKGGKDSSQADEINDSITSP